MGLEFYRSLPAFGGFLELLSGEHYQAVPADWWLVMTDVVGSTKAIEAGRYKEVNAAGSLPAMAISNLIGHMEFPFIFGGDGMTCLIPPDLEPQVRKILAGLGPVIKQAYQLDLRIALIPVQRLYDEGKPLRLARWEVSTQYTQAAIDGEGLDFAEALLKTPGNPYLIPPGAESVEPDLEGYSCRWQDFPTSKDETIALLVKFRHRDALSIPAFVRWIESLIGDPKEHHPLKIEKHKASVSGKNLRAEAALFTRGMNWWDAFKHRNFIRKQIFMTHLAVWFNKHHFVKKKDMSQIKVDNILSSDYRKYDTTLKMIVSVTTSARKQLEKKLEEERLKGTLFYGLHVTNRAMITCLVKFDQGQEVHFVDAADGGYAFAAKQMKLQIKALG